MAPFYASHIAKTDPFESHISATTEVNGEQVDVIQQGGGTLGLGEIPIGPTWQANYFIGADQQGRDVMARVLYGGGASLPTGGLSAPPFPPVARGPAPLAGGFPGLSPPSVFPALG